MINTDQAHDASDLHPRRKGYGSLLKAGLLRIIPGQKSTSRRSTENKSIAKGRGGSDLREARFGPVASVGFFHDAALRDPARLLQGTGNFMRHVKLRPGTTANTAELSRLIDAAYEDIKVRVENG